MGAIRPNRTHSVMAASALAHAGLLALLFLAAPEPQFEADAGVIPISLMDGATAAPRLAKPTPPTPPPATPSAPEAPEVEVEPPQPTDVEPIFVAANLPPVDPTLEPDPLTTPAALSVAAAASAAAGEVCELGAWLQAALQVDPEVTQALMAIPRPARSVANAIMMWDGRWVGAGPVATATTPIRMALVNGVLAAPEACRNEALRGPRLLILPDSAGSTILAVGSGEWRWGDLLLEEQATAPGIGDTRRP